MKGSLPFRNPPVANRQDSPNPCPKTCLRAPRTTDDTRVSRVFLSKLLKYCEEYVIISRADPVAFEKARAEAVRTVSPFCNFKKGVRETMKRKIPYTSPVDREQLPEITAHVARLEAYRRRVGTVAKICYCAAAVLFALLCGVLLCTLLYAYEKSDPEVAAAVADVEKIPLLGFLTQWCYRVLLNGMQRSVASALRLLAVLLAPGVLACLATWLLPKFGGGSDSSAAEDEPPSREEAYDRYLELSGRLRRLEFASNKAGTVLVRVTSGLLVLWGYAYLLYGVLCESRYGFFDLSGGALLWLILVMLVGSPILFLLFLWVQKLFLLPARIPSRAPMRASCRKLRAELDKAAQNELESMPTERLIAMAEELPFADGAAVEYMEIAASRGDPHAKEYLDACNSRQQETREKARDEAYLAARQADERGDYAAAKRQYKTLADEGHPDAMHNYARLAYRSGDTAEAIRYLQKSIDTGYYDDEETHRLLNALKSGKRINIE